MKETKFKILVHCGEYVNANLLENGIYTCSIPHLYNIEETIETLIDKSMMIQAVIGFYPSEKYIENLKQCKLINVIIKETN